MAKDAILSIGLPSNALLVSAVPYPPGIQQARFLEAIIPSHKKGSHRAFEDSPFVLEFR
jgi:hypothetical protein